MHDFEQSRVPGDVAIVPIRSVTTARDWKRDDEVRAGTGSRGTKSLSSHRRSSFRPPALPAIAISRRRLAALLDLATHQRLTIVVTPPGYGKTVLLSQWAHAHPSARIRWLTLTADDNDPELFVHDLLAAIAWPDFTVQRSGVKRRRAERTAVSEDALAGGLLTELDWLPPTTLVVDDFDAVSNGDLLDDFATFVEHAPHSLRVVLATRVDPPLRFYRLSSSAPLIELRQQDLAFTVDEAAELIRRITGRDLLLSSIVKLVARTEGWAAGLQLAGLSLLDRPNAELFVDEFARDHRFVADYLTDEVLRQQPTSVRSFLLATSVLDRMSGPLCDFVLDRTDGLAMLEDLDRKSLFTSPVDGHREWFRYHQLFRSLLRHQLHHEEAELEGHVLRRAGDWYLGRNDPETAVRYLLEAGAWERVLDVVATYATERFEMGRALAIAGWIEAVPAAAREGRVAMSLLEAAGFAFGGRPRRATHLLDAIVRPAMPSGESAVCSLLRAYVSLQEGAPSEAIAVAQSVARMAEDVDDADLVDVFGLTHDRVSLEAGAHAILGAGLAYEGRWDEARLCFAAAPTGGHPLWEVVKLGSVARLHAWSGELVVAERVANWVLSLASEVGCAQGLGTIDARLALVHVARRRNDLDRAAELLDEAKRWMPCTASPVVQSLVAVEDALLALADDRPEDGLTALAATRPRERTSLPGALVALRCAVAAQLHIAAGDLMAASEVLALAPVEISDVWAARVRLAIEREDLVAAREANAQWPSGPTPGAGLERDLWLAILEHLEGDEVGARVRIGSVVDRAAHERDLALFRNAHVLRPARSLYRHLPSPFLREILELPAASARRPRPITTLVEQLTERELIVLSLLPTRMSNVEMSRTLGVSVNTIKTHLKHIYRKLAVEERRDAVATGERLGLI